MSAGYGFFKIAVVKKDGSADFQKAKEVFDWCMQNYDWCSNENPFVLDGNYIVNNADDWEDGVDIKNTDIPGDNLKWLCEPAAAVGAERIVAELIADFSEISYDSNDYHSCVIEDGKMTYRENFNFNSYVMGKIDSATFYVAIDEYTHTDLAGAFRNKKTGKIKFLGGVEIKPNNEGDNILDATCNDDYYMEYYDECSNTYYTLLDKDGNNALHASDFDHFLDAEDVDFVADFAEDMDEEEEDWEFIGIKASPGVFEEYATADEPESDNFSTEEPAATDSAPVTENITYMKCTKCGAEINSKMKFCGKCGTPVPQTRKCTKCGADIALNMKFCGQCGAPVAAAKRFCTQCGKQIPGEMKFCPECGAKQE